MADIQNVSWFVFELSIVFHKSAVQDIYNVYYLKTLSMCIFNDVKMLLGIRFIVETFFGNPAYLHNLYSVVELHTKVP